MIGDIEWICQKCGTVHSIWYLASKCRRCGWNRPAKKETVEIKE